MHVADPRRGILGANAIVGASVPLAVGAALSSKLLGQDRVAVAFLGEGAVNQGAFHEGVNLAAIWDLPALLVCENNLYSEFSDSRRMARVASVAERMVAYGVEAATVDGNEVEAVYAASVEAVARCRGGGGPFLLEALTYRWHGHYEGDGQPYKPADEVAAWRARDPLELAVRHLVEHGDATAEDLERLREDASAAVERAVVLARESPAPDLDEAYAHVLVA